MPDLLWRSTPLTAETFLINSNAGNETGFSALANGSGVTSSVSGSAGVFQASTWGRGQHGEIWFSPGGAFTPAINGALLGWFLKSLDAGSTFETVYGSELERAPDFVIPLRNTAHAAGQRVAAAWPVRPPPVPFKVHVLNRSGVTLPTSTANWIKMLSTTVVSE